MTEFSKYIIGKRINIPVKLFNLTGKCGNNIRYDGIVVHLTNTNPIIKKLRVII